MWLTFWIWRIFFWNYDNFLTKLIIFRVGPEAFKGSDKESDYDAATDDEEENDDFKDESNERKIGGGLKRKFENTFDDGEKCKSSEMNSSLEEGLFEDV